MMEITGTRAIPAPRDVVWAALNDPVVLKACLPGCESVERVNADTFKVVVATAIGPLRARFNGTLRMTEACPPQSCVMVFEGQGGAVGFAKGSSTVSLQEAPGGTELSYSAQAQIGGKLAQVGSRLIDGVARKMSDDFFKAFCVQLSPPLPQAPAAAVPPGSSAMPSPSLLNEAAAGPERADMPAEANARHNSGRSEHQASMAGPVMVPGWWLAVSAVLGASAVLAGALLIH